MERGDDGVDGLRDGGHLTDGVDLRELGDEEVHDAPQILDRQLVEPDLRPQTRADDARLLAENVGQDRDVQDAESVEVSGGESRERWREVGEGGERQKGRGLKGV